MTDENRRAPDDVALAVVRHDRRKPCTDPKECELLMNTSERLAEGTARMERIEAEVCGISATQYESQQNIKRIEGKLDENSAATEELLSIIRAGKGFFKVAGWVATTIKWAAGLALPLVGLWLALKDGMHK